MSLCVHIHIFLGSTYLEDLGSLALSLRGPETRAHLEPRSWNLNTVIQRKEQCLLECI